jgi:hypothetical protein
VRCGTAKELMSALGQKQTLHRNLVVEYRPTDMGRDAAFAAAAEMIRANVELIVADGAEFNLQAAVAASRTIPIVGLKLHIT